MINDYLLEDDGEETTTDLPEEETPATDQPAEDEAEGTGTEV
jgi:hypothetical protein